MLEKCILQVDLLLFQLSPPKSLILAKNRAGNIFDFYSQIHRFPDILFFLYKVKLISALYD